MNLKAHTCSPSASSLDFDAIAATPLSVPLSRQEDRIATALLRRKMEQEKDGIVHFRTGGQVKLTKKTTTMQLPWVLAYHHVDGKKLQGAIITSHPTNSAHTQQGAGETSASVQWGGPGVPTQQRDQSVLPGGKRENPQGAARWIQCQDSNTHCFGHEGKPGDTLVKTPGH